MLHSALYILKWKCSENSEWYFLEFLNVSQPSGWFEGEKQPGDITMFFLLPVKSHTTQLSSKLSWNFLDMNYWSGKFHCYTPLYEFVFLEDIIYTLFSL